MRHSSMNQMNLINDDTQHDTDYNHDFIYLPIAQCDMKLTCNITVTAQWYAEMQCNSSKSTD